MKTFLCLVYCAAAALWMFGPAAQAQVKIGPPPQPNAGWIGIPVQNYAALDLSALAPANPSDGWYSAGAGALQENGKVSFLHSVESNGTQPSGVLNEYQFEQGSVTLTQRVPLQQTTPTPDGPMPLSLGEGSGSFLTPGGRLFLNDRAYLRFETPSGDPHCPLIVHLYGWNTNAEIQGGVPRTMFPPSPHDCEPGGAPPCNYVSQYRSPWMVVTGANDSGYICGQGTGFCYGKTNPDGTTTIRGAGDYAGLIYGPNKTTIFDPNGSSFDPGSPSLQIVGETFVPQSVNRNGWAINGVILWSSLPQNGYIFWSEHPKAWNGTSLIDIGPGFYNSGRLFALNDQNQIIGSNLTEQREEEGFLWENGSATYFRDQLPKNIQGQMNQITPIAVSNQRTPAPAVPLEPDRSLCVLTSSNNDNYSRQIWKRDNAGAWSVAYIQVPQNASIDWWTITASKSGINSSGIIAVRGTTDVFSGDSHSLLLVPVDIKVHQTKNAPDGSAPKYINAPKDHIASNLFSLWPNEEAIVKVKLPPPYDQQQNLPPGMVKWSVPGHTVPDNTLEAPLSWPLGLVSNTKQVTINIGGTDFKLHFKIVSVSYVSEAEASLLVPYAAAIMGSYAQEAINFGATYPQGPKRDAMRHSYWCSVSASTFPATSGDVAIISTAHEYDNRHDQKQQAFNSAMDLKNNSVGMSVNYQHNGLPDKSAIKQDLDERYWLGHMYIWEIPDGAKVTEDASEGILLNSNRTRIYP